MALIGRKNNSQTSGQYGAFFLLAIPFPISSSSPSSLSSVWYETFISCFLFCSFYSFTWARDFHWNRRMFIIHSFHFNWTKLTECLQPLLGIWGYRLNWTIEARSIRHFRCLDAKLSIATRGHFDDSETGMWIVSLPFSFLLFYCSISGAPSSIHCHWPHPIPHFPASFTDCTWFISFWEVLEVNAKR